MSKNMYMEKNPAGGYDLLIERDADNLVRILTGNLVNSLDVWTDLRDLSAQAIDELYGDGIDLDLL